MESKLRDLLARNDIGLDVYLEQSYKCLIISIFEVLVAEMRDDKYRNEVRRRFINSGNKGLTAKRTVFEATKCRLSDTEAEEMYRYIHAFLTKGNKRVIYGQDVREKCLRVQRNRCKICEKKIDLDDSELDHIIPWAYVGDELGIENMQMLCRDCNRRKSKNVAYNLKMFLVGERGD